MARPEGTSGGRPRQGTLSFPGTTLGSALGALEGVNVQRAESAWANLWKKAGEKYREATPPTTLRGRLSRLVEGNESRMSPELRQEFGARDAMIHDSPLVARRHVERLMEGLSPADEAIVTARLAGEHGSEKPYEALMERLGKERPEEAALQASAIEDARKEIADLSDELAVRGRIAMSTRAKYEPGWAAKMYVEGARRKVADRGGLRGGTARPKAVQHSYREDANGFATRLDKATVEQLLDAAGLESPEGKPYHNLVESSRGTLVEWPPTMEGQYQKDLFRLALEDHARTQAEIPLSSGRIIGGGDPRMVVQVGKGSRGDVGHLAEAKWDERSLRLKMPRSLAREIAAGVKVDAPKITSSGSALRAEFKTPEAREAFLNGVREVAVEGATFNVTPKARQWLAQRLRGARLRTGEGAGGGIGHLIQEGGDFGPLSPEERSSLGEVREPGAVAFETLRRLRREVADARLLDAVAGKEGPGGDAAGKWSLEAPEGSQPGDVLQQGGAEYVVAPDDASWGPLKGRAVRKDIRDAWATRVELGDAWDHRVNGFMSHWRQVFLGHPAFVPLNVVGNEMMAMADGVQPAQVLFTHGPKAAWDTTRITLEEFGKFAKALRSSKATPAMESAARAGTRLGFDEFTGRKKTDAILKDYYALLRDQIAPVMRAQGKTAADIASFGLLSEGYGKVPGAAVAAAGGALTGGASGYFMAEDDADRWKYARRGAAAGAAVAGAFNPVGRTALKMASLADAFRKSVSFRVHTEVFGKDAPSAQAEVKDFYQDYEHASPASRALSGRAPGKAGAVGLLVGNPFVAFLGQLGKTFRNAAAKHPVTGLLPLVAAFPVARLIAEAVDGAYGGDEEKKRAAREAFPTSIPRTTTGEDGESKTMMYDMRRWALGLDVADNLNQAVSEGGKEWGPVVRNFLLGGPVPSGFESVGVLSNKDQKTLVGGYPIVEPGQTQEQAAVLHGAQAFASPWQPGVGRTARKIAAETVKPFKKGVQPEPGDPVRVAVEGLTGVRARALDFDAVARQVTLDNQSEIRDIDESLGKELRQANTLANPKAILAAIEKAKTAKLAAVERMTKRLKRLTPQMAGEGAR